MGRLERGKGRLGIGERRRGCPHVGMRVHVHIICSRKMYLFCISIISLVVALLYQGVHHVSREHMLTRACTHTLAYTYAYVNTQAHTHTHTHAHTSTQSKRHADRQKAKERARERASERERARARVCVRERERERESVCV